MIVQFYNVSKTYPNGVNALNDVSFKLNQGEFIFLMGPSGAGKSTLIKLMLREEIPTHLSQFYRIPQCGSHAEKNFLAFV